MKSPAVWYGTEAFTSHSTCPPLIHRSRTTQAGAPLKHTPCSTLPPPNTRVQLIIYLSDWRGAFTSVMQCKETLRGVCRSSQPIFAPLFGCAVMEELQLSATETPKYKDCIFKGALCSSGGSPPTFFFFFKCLNKINEPLFAFMSWINRVNKLALKDKTFWYCLTLFICGGPSHLSSFKQCSVDFLWEQLVYKYVWVCIITSWVWILLKNYKVPL